MSTALWVTVKRNGTAFEGKVSRDSVKLLYEAAIHAFSQEQEVQEILLFGSFAQGTYDQYSDIDLYVVSCDFEKTMAHLPHILKSIDEVLVQYPLHTERGCAAYMTLFRNYPLYTKLDFNVLDMRAQKPFAGAKSIYRREGTSLSYQSELIAPIFEKSLHTLFDYYLGAIRYTKYRKRGMHLSAYKFYRAQVDQFLLRYYQKITHAFNISQLERLGIVEYQVLDKQTDLKQWERYLYPEDEHTMNALYLELLQAAQNDAKLDSDTHYRDVLTTIHFFIMRELGS